MFQEVLDKVWFIEGQNRGRYPYSNSLFINDRKKLLIDTGIGRSRIKKLLTQFGQPDIILYSHAHEDHIYDPTLFTGSRFIHEKDRLMALSKDELLRQYGMDSPELRTLLDAFLKPYHYQPLTDLNILVDAQVFDLGTIQVQILHSPGHSAGHCSFEISNEGFIFSSDIDLTSFGPWYGGLDSSILEFEQSMHTHMQKSPKILITSHKGIVLDDINEKLERFLQKIPERSERILRFLETEKTLEALVPHALVHGKLYDPIEYYLAAEKIMLQKHLALLLDQKKIEYHQGTYRAL